MSEIVQVALIVAVFGVLTPLSIRWYDNRTRHQDRLFDIQRQDEVAKRVATAAEQTAAAAKLLVESNQTVADKADAAARTTLGKLEQIHTLVNSNMTQALQDSLDSTLRELVALHEIIDLKRQQGIEPTVDGLAAIVSAENRTSELRSTLADRLSQSRLADQQGAQK